MADTNNTLLLDNYIYISHIDDVAPTFWRLPTCPDIINDTMQSTYQQTTALGRSAPVYTFSNAGPRSVQFEFKLHRDIMDDMNAGVSNAVLAPGEDYIENLIRAIQSIAVPRYNLSNKAVEPPLVAVRIGDQIFIKGVVTQAPGVTYEKPILYNNKYAVLTVSFVISEVDPYDASTVYKNGSFRGMVKTLSGAYPNGMNPEE